MAILMRTLLVLATLAVLFTPGCAPAPTAVELTETRLAVHAVLVADAESAVAYIARAQRTRPEAWQDVAPEPVTGAAVRLVHDGDTLVFAAGGACVPAEAGVGVLVPGCYAAIVPGGVRAGARYELLIDVAGFATVRGETRVPLPPVLDEPVSGPSLHFNQTLNPAQPADSVTVRWTAHEGTPRAELRFIADRDDCFATITTPNAFHGMERVEVRRASSVTVSPWRVQCSGIAVQRYDARLLLTIFDANYDEYLRQNARGNSVMLTDASVGVTNALGVFGAAASAATAVTLIAR
jgi:hypothetical protein